MSLIVGLRRRLAAFFAEVWFVVTVVAALARGAYLG